MSKDEFKKSRQSVGHTQASLAKAMGIHLRTVWRWELGETTIPKVDELALRYIAERAEAYRDAIDLKEARRAIAEAKKRGTVPWPKIKNDAGLKQRPKEH